MFPEEKLVWEQIYAGVRDRGREGRREGQREVGTE